MRKFTVSEKIAGESIISRLSEKAQWVYNETDPLRVYEYDDVHEDYGKKLYAYDGAF